MSSSPTRRSAARRRRASRATSPRTSRPPRPPCCSCNSSCGSCGGRPSRDGRRWSCRTGRCSAMACAPASRRNCSRSSTCTPSCACRTACSRPTRPSRRTSCSSTGRGPTKDVWYYEQPLPEGRKNYTKTQPIQFEEFAAVPGVVEEAGGERAGVEGASRGVAGQTDCNLDRKNPRGKEDITHLPPEQLVASILEKERRIVRRS